MPDLPIPGIHITRRDAPPDGRWQAVVANRRLTSTFEIKELAPFADVEPVPLPVSGHSVDRVVMPEPRRVKGWVGGQMRTVACRGSANGYDLDVDSIGTFEIAADGSEINYGGRAERRLLAEGLLGPALTFALALQGTYCLHASAARHGDQLIAFAGTSGCGKSTLAAALDQRSGWQRAADDVLPITWTGSAVRALPHFPQLKLPDDAQYPASAPPALPVTGVVIVTRAGPGASPALLPLRGHNAATTFITQTMTTSLFPPALLARHLTASGLMAEHSAVLQLIYPHNRGKVKDVVALIGEWLAGPG